MGELTQESIPSIWPGDNVRVLDKPGGTPVSDSHGWGGVWYVKRENPKGWGVEQPATGRRGTLPYVLAVKTDDPLAPPRPEDEPRVTRTVWPGELVRLTGSTKNDADQVYVVIADKGERVNVAKLGGDGGRYVRAPRRMIELVDPSVVQIVD